MTVPARADVVSVIGGSLKANNPTGSTPVAVQAKYLGDSGSLYTNELFLDSPSFIGPIFNNHTTPVNATAGLGSFLPETVLFIRNQSFYIETPGNPAINNFGFFTGNGTFPLNPDRLPHAVFTFDTDNPGGPVTVGFEDQFGGGDRDFNDAVYSFTNVKVGFVDVALTPTNIPIGNTVTLDFDGTQSFAGYNGSFENAGTVANHGSILNYGIGSNAGQFDNFGDLLNDVIGQFNLTGQLNNEGGVRNFGGGILGTLGGTAPPIGTGVGGIIQEAGSSITNTDSGNIDNNGSWVNNGQNTNAGTVTNSGVIKNVGTTVNQATGFISNTLTGAINNLGTWANQTGAATNNSGTVENTGVIDNSGVIENIGTVTNQAAGQINNQLGGAVNNLGTWINTPGSQTQNAGDIANSGAYTVQSTATVTGEGTYTQTNANAVTTINGVLSQSIVDIQSGVLGGAGVIEGYLNAGSGATISPGNSPGTLEVDGDFMLDGGKLNIELAALAVHDILNISGEATFDGGIVNYLFAFTPTLGDSFVFLTANGGISGDETLTFFVTGNVGGLTFETEVIGNSLVLTAVPEPGTVWVLSVALIAATRRARRKP